MNRMQKMAWVGFLGTLTISVTYPITFAFLFLKPDYLRFACIVVCITAAALFAALVWAYRKKQSPSEPDYDERDRQISHQAVIVSFVTLSILIYISDALVIIWTGFDGTVLTSIFPIIHLGVGFFALTVYYAASIILYSKDNKQTEGGSV